MNKSTLQQVKQLCTHTRLCAFYVLQIILFSALLFICILFSSPPFLYAQSSSDDYPPDRIHGTRSPRYYTIQPSDTLYTVALEIGIDLDETNCLVAPDFTWEQPLVIGDVLEVPPSDIHCHQVIEGESLAAIAEQYDTTPGIITNIQWNSSSDVKLTALNPDEPLPAGLHLRVPPLEEQRPVDLNTATTELAEILSMKADTIPFVSFAVGGPVPVQPRIAIPADWPYGSGHFTWPTSGWLSQGFHNSHRAVDIASPYGTAVRAADRGVVIRAGWNTQGYGNLIIIDHKIDYVTLYAHLSEIYVQEGDIVGLGDLIGAVGSTGNSTGAHLHFEIRDFGQRADPLALLPQ